jgi:hypothetical protein
MMAWQGRRITLVSARTARAQADYRARRITNRVTLATVRIIELMKASTSM